MRIAILAHCKSMGVHACAARASHSARIRIVCGLVLAAAGLAGCGTLPNGRRWGQDVTLKPGWDRLGQTAMDNLRDPLTWAPIAGAGLLQIGGLDRDISDWARERTPVYGSTSNAEDASDKWRSVSYALWFPTLIATPGGDTFGEWTWSKAKGAAVEFAARGVSRGVTTVFKDVVGRERPNEEDNLSFPSGHMTEAYGNAVLGSRNLDSVDLPGVVIWPYRIALYGSSVATGWARVEAGAHYPSDVLFAAGMTNFVCGWLHDAFMGLNANPDIVAGTAPSGEGWQIGLRWSL